MKILNIRKLAFAILLLAGMVSCKTFLNRPAEDSYTIDGFYQTDAQCFQSVNPIYNSPWYDFQRGFVKIGDVLSGNIYYGTDNAYQSFVLKSNDDDLRNASASLWSVNAYCNGIVENINLKSGPAVSEATKNTVKGEAMTWTPDGTALLVAGERDDRLLRVELPVTAANAPTPVASPSAAASAAPSPGPSADAAPVSTDDASMPVAVLAVGLLVLAGLVIAIAEVRRRRAPAAPRG